MFLNFRPIRGQAFTACWTNDIATGFGTAVAYNKIAISKDGGSFNASTNTPSFLLQIPGTTTKMAVRIDLTASEMDADIIVLYPYVTSSPNSLAQPIIIYTTPAELSAVPNLNSSLADKITAIFQYLFFKKTVTATTETLFKSDGTTSLGTATLSDDGTTFAKGAQA